MAPIFDGVESNISSRRTVASRAEGEGRCEHQILEEGISMQISLRCAATVFSLLKMEFQSLTHFGTDFSFLIHVPRIILLNINTHTPSLKIEELGITGEKKNS